MKSVLLTGASGFVGKRFTSRNLDKHNIKSISLQTTQVNEIDFTGIDTIVHLAGIAHRMEKTEDSLYYKVNFELTRDLANKAKENGVKHFIFMSTIKVYGDEHDMLTLETPCTPNDAYGKSKLMAEEYVESLISKDFKVSIVRPPLVYGPGVIGNMKKLIDLVGKRNFLPLGNIKNKRSMVGLDNLIAFLNRIIEKEVSGIFLVQDDKPMSTSDLIRTIAKSRNPNLKLIAIPGLFQTILKKLVPEIHKRLFGSLVVDDHESKRRIDFKSALSFEEGIELMIKEN
jgi:UDP-glucose 4-epimerase